jgi:hypothetical protein
MALQLRRGTNQQRLGLTPVEGEMIYITDSILATISVTSINVSSEILATTTPHGLIINQQVKYLGATLNGLTKDQVYFVKTAPTITEFSLSTSLGGGTLNITGTFTVPLVFATTPTNAAGTPIGYTESALWAGDGTTVGGLAVGITNLDALQDVVITQPVTEGDFLWYDGTNWINTHEPSVDSRNETLNLTRRYTTDVQEYESPVALRLNARVTDAINDNTDDAGPTLRFARSSGTQYEKTYVSGGAIGAFTVTLNNVTNLVVGNKVTGTGLPDGNGALITVIAGNQLTLDTAFTVQASGTYTIGESVGFGQIAFEYFGTTDLHRFKVTSSTDNFLEVPPDTYPGTTVLIASDKNSTTINQGVLHVNAVDDRVGVNNTNPSHDFQVGSSSTVSPQIALTNTERSLIITNNSANDTLSFNYNSANRLEFNTSNAWFNSGRLGVNNSNPTATLDVTGAAVISGNLSVDSGVLFVDTTNNRVGINNSTPNFALDVGGSGYISGDLIVASGTITTSVGSGGTANLFNNDSIGTINIGNGVQTAINLGRAGIGEVFIKSPLLDVSTSIATPNITTLSGADMTIAPSSGGELTLTTTASSDPVTATRIVSLTNARTRTFRTRAESTGTPVVGFGNIITLESETTPGTFGTGGYLETLSTAATGGVLDTFRMNFGLMNTTGGVTTVVPRMTLEGNGDLQIDGDLEVTGGDIDRTTSGQANIFNTNANDINIGNSAGTTRIGAAGVSNTVLIKPGILVGEGTTQNVFNTVATTVNAFGATSTALNLGNIGGLTTVAGRLKGALTLETPNSEVVTSGNISIGTALTEFTTGASGQTSTLPGANEGQFKTLFRSTTGAGSMVVTVTNAGWKGGASGTINFGNQGDSCFLQCIAGRWYVLGSYDVTFA